MTLESKIGLYWPFYKEIIQIKTSYKREILKDHGAFIDMNFRIYIKTEDLVNRIGFELHVSKRALFGILRGLEFKQKTISVEGKNLWVWSRKLTDNECKRIFFRTTSAIYRKRGKNAD
jgi:hypothetical protein